ncbi:MAG TPA: cysteine--tRNA ligase [Candidatus Saccharimonadales bacterium]|nr:cysteine--tRNA ligase [Candidatus Saccharimonadales bacterium]
MTLQLHNTLTKKLEIFTPQQEGKVSLYTCGPTVYNYLHVGNWAAYIYWDTLVRTLLANGYTVERVMNITDVGHLTSDADEGEDKLEKGARREGKTAWQVAEMYSEDFLAGMEKLGLLLPEHITRATEFIPQQLELVRILKEKGVTYQINDGIYFDTSKFPSYADFAGLDLAAQKAGARVEFNTDKRNPSDFALWKFTPANEKRDMEWETPDDLLELPQPDDSDEKIMGFPGWHLECSAMSMSILGPTLDIHTGGIDHIPVHHTNEIAQSESASGQQFSRYWLHNNHLKSDGTKISKSLGNGYTLQDLAQRGYSPLDYRLFVLQSQYSSESNFTFENLTAAKNRRYHWRNIAALRHQTHDTLTDDSDKAITLLATSQAIIEALNDNLNTPEALRIVDQAFSKFDGKSLGDIHQHGLVQVLETIDEILGLQLLETTPDIDDETKQLIIKRQRARDDKNREVSDQIRDQIATKGIVVIDTSGGTIWEYADVVA